MPFFDREKENIDKSYLEHGLPENLVKSIQAFVNTPSLYDCLYGELQSDINVAELCDEITEEQAWYLREKYLCIKRREF